MSKHINDRSYVQIQGTMACVAVRIAFARSYIPHRSHVRNTVLPVKREGRVVMFKVIRTTVPMVLFLFGAVPLHGQEDQDTPQVRTTAIREGVHMVSATGGNMAVFLGSDGIFMVDADYAEMSAHILDAIRELATGVSTPPATAGTSRRVGQEPLIRYLVNTHWHFDHTSGNENLAEAGATIVAHEGVLRLLSEDQVMDALGGREVPAAPPGARPVITFNDRMNIRWNGDLIHVVHMPFAHSDGDVVVHFRDASVVHMGDIFFNGMYPFIDVDHGGNIDGMVAAVEEVLAHTDESTVFIPGHGPLATPAELEAYGGMLRTVRDRVRALVEEGLTREEVVAREPTADLDPIWAGPDSRDPAFFVGLVYDGMVRDPGEG
jgi:glyoxylase-like metal-dependent hydrolase (beta-lactamase superfamily II)